MKRTSTCVFHKFSGGFAVGRGIMILRNRYNWQGKMEYCLLNKGKLRHKCMYSWLNSVFLPYVVSVYDTPEYSITVYKLRRHYQKRREEVSVKATLSVFASLIWCLLRNRKNL